MINVYKWILDWIEEVRNNTGNNNFLVKVILWIDRGMNIDDWERISKEMLNVLEKYPEYKVYTTWFDLNCSEAENPPIKFENILKEWKSLWYELRIHAWESISNSISDKSLYIKQAIDLNVDAIGHGVLCTDDNETLR